MSDELNLHSQETTQNATTPASEPAREQSATTAARVEDSRYEIAHRNNRLLVLLCLLLLAGLAFEGVSLYRMHGDMNRVIATLSNGNANIAQPAGAALTANSTAPGAAQTAVPAMMLPSMPAIPSMAALMNNIWGPNWSGMPNVSIPAMSAHLSDPSITTNSDNDYVVKLQIPGIDADNLKIDIQGRQVTVSGTSTADHTTTGKNGKAVAESQSTTSFEQAVTLPGAVNAAKMQRSYKDGVLTLTLPRSGGNS